MPYKPIDATGRRIKVGDTVRIVGLPKLDGMREDVLEEFGTREVFTYLVGKYKKVWDFDEFGCVELFFNIDKSPCSGTHSVAIEPWLVRVRRPRW